MHLESDSRRKEERYGAKLPGSNKLGPSALVATSKGKLEVKLCPQQNPLVVNWRFRVVQVVRGHFWLAFFGSDLRIVHFQCRARYTRKVIKGAIGQCWVWAYIVSVLFADLSTTVVHECSAIERASLLRQQMAPFIHWQMRVKQSGSLHTVPVVT